MKEILFFEPLYKKKIWGTEVWLCSGLVESPSLVASGSFKGRDLSSLWREEIGLEFPYLIKIIYAAEDLSIQVHPSDEQALSLGSGTRGKPECWYVLDAKTGGSVILGHHAATRKSFEASYHSKDWRTLLNYQPIGRGDFIYIPGGTLHALRKGAMVLEVQQPSDTTFRLYDYDRLENGKSRPLHIKECLDIISIPHPEMQLHFSHTHHLDTPYFKLVRLVVPKVRVLLQKKGVTVLCVVKGSGTVDGMPLEMGDCFLVPENYGFYKLQGHLVLIAVTDPSVQQFGDAVNDSIGYYF